MGVRGIGPTCAYVFEQAAFMQPLEPGMKRRTD
jgi:hypothetical protein